MTAAPCRSHRRAVACQRGMKLVIAAALAASACTTLGPMPATTGVAAVPANRPGLEATAGIMPGFHLSEGAKREPTGSILGQTSIIVEPDRLLGTKGLVLGARSWGNEEDVGREPMIGYRRRYDEHSAIAVIGYATHLSGTNQGASYEGTHAGAELSFDGRLFGNRWVALHLQATGSVSYLAARGSYCVGEQGYGTDCDNDGRDHRVDAHLTGLFPAATASFAIDFARRETGVLHGVRLAFLTTYGAMPVIRYREPYDTTPYASFGLSLTLGLGADR
jgi:hypothetical protein